MSKIIAYEQPLNERIRTFLRLEFMLQQIQAALKGTTSWDTRNALSTLLDIQSIFQRADIKTDLIRELERLNGVLQRLGEKPGVDKSKLGAVLDEISTHADRLHALPGPIGFELKDNELLNAIRQRTSIPGGACHFDLPSYHFWLERSADRRMTDITAWFQLFEAPMRAAQLVMKLIRESSPSSHEIAEGGFFQQSLDPNGAVQLVRVAVDEDCPYYAEISGGKHRFAIRFMSLRMNERDVPASEDVAFQLTCAVI